jgi:hypothetical protein
MRGVALQSVTKFIVFAALLAILSCASNSPKNECPVADWYEIGRQAGVAGQSQDAFKTHQTRCPDAEKDLFDIGWLSGLAEFCTQGNGLSLGRSGLDYNNICPPELETEFLTKYKLGRQIHQLEQDSQRINQSIKELTASSDTEETKMRLQQLQASLDKNRKELKKLESSLN